MTKITCFALGIPQTQGSLKAFPNPRPGGQPIVTSDNPRNKSWRSVVAGAMTDANTSGVLITGPVRVTMAFVLPRPKALGIVRYVEHTKRPDIDKLIRSVLDAGKGTLWRDDSQVVEISSWKRYAEHGEQTGVLFSADY